MRINLKHNIYIGIYTMNKFSLIKGQLEGTPWYISNLKDPMGLSIVILSKNSNQELSVANYKGEWTGIHGYEEEMPSILPEHYGKYKCGRNEIFNFNGPEDVLPWLKENMDKNITFRESFWA
jgi:hypothetical protein